MSRFTGLIGCILFLCLVSQLPAQNVHLFGMEPALGIEGKVSNRLGYFLQVSSESQLNSAELEEEVYDNGIRNVDFQVGISSNFTPDLSGAASFTFRLREPLKGEITTELRPTQQLTLSNNFSKYRFRHRLRADERFIQREKSGRHEFDLRLRYRLSLDFPLQGDRLDDREFYLNSNAEFLYTPTESDAFFYREYRLYTGAGYQIDKHVKLELGGTVESARISRDLGRENVWLLKLICAIQI